MSNLHHSRNERTQKQLSMNKRKSQQRGTLSLKAKRKKQPEIVEEKFKNLPTDRA